MSSYQHERHFSLGEATAALAKVKPLVEELAALKQVLDAEGFSFTPPAEPSAAVKAQTNGHQPPLEAFVRLQQVLYTVMERGILVRDLGQGLLDFPHIRATGEEVYLCWRLGEEELAFWHPVGGGFAGREPLATL